MGMDNSIERYKGKYKNADEVWEKHSVDTYVDEPCYWRKAYWLNHWFCKNVKEEFGADGEMVILTKEEVENFLLYCKDIKYKLENDLDTKIEEYDWYFGITKESHIEEIEDAINQIENLLINADFENYTYVYNVSY